MIVYQSTKQGFRDDVFSNEIDKKILEAYKIHLGRSTSANETLSWKNSMSYMDRIMEDPDIPADAGISIEFQIPLTSKRIDFVGGIRGLGELKRRVDNGEMKVAFALYPVSMEQLINIADTGNIMPPKTTWFEPKLRSGMVIHKI